VPGAVPYGDVIVPYVMAACLIAALAHRRQGGAGCHIDASMYEICVQQMHEALLAAQRGTPLRRAGNADPGVYHQDVYPARGEDRWVAITLQDAAQAGRLAQLSGGKPLHEWTSGQQDIELVERLQAEGIAAGVVQDIEDMMADPVLQARGALVELPHPYLGPFGHMRTPISLSLDAGEPYRAPKLGEHGREVALSIAGLDEERYAALVAAGALK
jgi:crotonobetainyl-CoA:carnitine CoA-transferase CaiB-like acyl-CoA transferase